MFDIFFRLGFQHLTELGAWDHQLFLATLALALSTARWRQWIVLASLFALGHALATAALLFGWVPDGMPWVEPAIAASITLLALIDLYSLQRDPFGIARSTMTRLQVLTVAFGIIHGLGIGGAFLSIAGRDQQTGTVLVNLVGFALGVEVAQLLLLLGYWLFCWVIFDLWQYKPLLLRRIFLLLVASAGLYKLVSLLS